MGELTPIDAEQLTDRDLTLAVWKGVVQTHGCLEKHIAETKLAHLTATEKRQELQDDILDIRENVVEISQALGVRKPEEGKPVKAKVGVPLVEHLKLAGTVGGSIVGIAALYKFAIAVWPAIDAYLRGLS